MEIFLLLMQFYEYCNVVMGNVDHSLANVSNGVHPATYAHLVPDIGWVAELMDNSNMVWIRTAEELFLQSQRINLDVEKNITNILLLKYLKYPLKGSKTKL